MSDLLQEYKDYYRVRMERYANNSHYPNLYEAEKTLFEAMDSCSELEEFRDKLGDKNEKCAIALVKDKETLHLSHWQEVKEDVRALYSQRVIAKVDQCATAMDIATLASDESSKNSIEISMDENIRAFWSNAKILDDIEIFKNAKVPSHRQASMDRAVEEFKESFVKSWTGIEEQMQPWQEGWQVKFDDVYFPRHRGYVPVSDENLAQRVQEAKSLLSR